MKNGVKIKKTMGNKCKCPFCGTVNTTVDVNSNVRCGHCTGVIRRRRGTVFGGVINIFTWRFENIQKAKKRQASVSGCRGLRSVKI